PPALPTTTHEGPELAQGTCPPAIPGCAGDNPTPHKTTISDTQSHASGSTGMDSGLLTSYISKIRSVASDLDNELNAQIYKGGSEEDAQVTGAYAFAGVQGDYKEIAEGEGLFLGGYDEEGGAYWGSLVGGGSHGITHGRERIHFLNGESETEHVAMIETKVFGTGKFSFGLGGTINEDEPSRISFYAYCSSGKFCAGAGVELRMHDQMNNMMASELKALGIDVVDHSADGSTPPSVPDIGKFSALSKSWATFFRVEIPQAIEKITSYKFPTMTRIFADHRKFED
ncbi:hypothetical protein ACIPJS_39565, partial [Streptomyces sp. NPDC086783]|uniref:hypothetical protein n=1 Tax=Streptomyces sp. NPDC086783 TaxID=3365758 RepID=UPI003825194D